MITENRCKNLRSTIARFMNSKKTHEYLVAQFMVETSRAYKKNPLFWMSNSNLIQYKLELKSLLKHFGYSYLHMEKQLLLIQVLLRKISPKKTKGHKTWILPFLISTLSTRLIPFFSIVISNLPSIDRNNLESINIFGGFQ
jgi:hypothetical protein